MNKVVQTISMRIAVFLAVLGISHGLQAQICGATNTNGCNVDWFSAVSFKNSKGASASYSGLSCGNTGSTNKTMTNGAVMDMSPGEQITMTVENTCTFTEWAMVWIDMDGSGTFTSAECISGTSGPLGSLAPNTTKTATLTLPCMTVKGGKVIMRLRCMYNNQNNNAGCGTIASYGNILDFEINLLPTKPPVADFTVPTGPNYIKTPILFTSNSNSSAYTQTWKFYGGSAVVPTGPKGRGKWAANGTYDVQLNQSFCGSNDSIIKQVVIKTPTAVPQADFIAASNQVEIYYTTTISDISTNGAHTWAWTLTSPTGMVYTSSAQNPVFYFDELGKWDVCLVATNDIGSSTKVCKTKYIECIPPSEFYLGPNKLATNQGGKIYDNGGPGANYGNNRKVTIDYFKILPCGAKEIRLKLTQIRLADAGDKLRIYDGYDESGKEITPLGGINSTNQTNYRNYTWKATSGAMYMTFESNASGNDSGFIGVWDSELLSPTKPKSDWTTDYDPAANGMSVTFNSNVTKAQGSVGYEWIIDGAAGIGYQPTLDYKFFTDGQYDVCLVAATCNGNDTFCKKITITTPTAPGFLDYTASNLRPKVGDRVTITTKTDYASDFQWSIFPTTFSYVNGTSASSRNPEITFNAGGVYTFTLIAWNSVAGKSATEKKLIKSKYVVAVTYCTPTVDLLSTDVGISRVTLSKDSNILFEQESAVGDIPYSNFVDDVSASLTFGTEYTLEVKRRTNSNPVNFKAWIDYNIDGDFDDAGEEILNTGSINSVTGTVNFKTPTLVNSFEGPTRMRVAAAYGSYSNTPCGINLVGEFEDYGILLYNDKKAPVITLIGNDTVRVEKSGSQFGCYSEVKGITYKGSDPTEGDLTNDVVVTTDLDCRVPGFYFYNFTLKDASGNQAESKRRVVWVVLDKTPPTLTLNGTSPMTVEQCDVFNDPGAVASDLVDGNLTTSIKTTGSVNTGIPGSYTLTYTVHDAQGNYASVNRVVNVVDTKKPGIFEKTSRIVDGTVVNVQIGSIFVDDVYAMDECNGSIAVTKTPGFNGPVNTLVRATYPITYFATDPNGNKADEYGFTVNYKVDDFISPEISLNTADTITHDVNTTYSSQQVSVFDNYYPINKISVVKTGKVNPFVLGVYSEKYTATDESGNVGTKTRFVKVVDHEAPGIITSSVNLCVGTYFWPMSDITVSDNYYSSADLLPLVKVVNSNLNIWKAGLYFINYQVTDPSGNKSAVVLRPVLVQYGNDCDNSFAGTKDLSLSKAISLYPNPTTGEVTVDYNLRNQQPLTVEVYNALGSKIHSTTVQNGGFGSQTMDLSRFGNGTYVVRFTNQGETTTRKVVVTR
ncbi:MAG: DUF5011 domain-containing protein [Bacteroidetes bacterium]|nr:DUF5011 domain-containing protein [Bacteroidota bacterium]